MELLRGQGAAVLGSHGQALTLLKGLPSGYNRDLQCIKPLVRQAAETLFALCRLAEAFLAHLDFDRDRIIASLAEGGIGATLRMEQKVLEGLPLREAHHAVAVEVRAGGAAPLAGEVESAARYQTIGSASPAETRRVAAELLRVLS
jgi:argininosuccinate lyase